MKLKNIQLTPVLFCLGFSDMCFVFAFKNTSSLEIKYIMQRLSSNSEFKLRKSVYEKYDKHSSEKCVVPFAWLVSPSIS